MESTRVQLQYLGRLLLAAVPGLLIAGVFWEVALGDLQTTYPILLAGFLIGVFGWALIDLKAYRRGFELSQQLLRESLQERNLSLFCTMLMLFLVQVVMRLLAGKSPAPAFTLILFFGVTFAFKHLLVTNWLASRPRSRAMDSSRGASRDL